ncbi:hypothetical protein MUO65_04085 [bacterium]|nr:hypothetical protein [bacterium]
MKDLTIIYYTANVLNENFAEKVRRQILIAAGDLPIISVSKKPLDFGTNICVGETERSSVNIFYAILRGSKEAKTKYLALAEDDVLYSPGHFYSYRPPDDTFAYNLSKWTFLTWKRPPFFSLKFRRTLATLIAPRDLMIEYIEERFSKYPDISAVPEAIIPEPGRGYEKNSGYANRKAEDFYTYEPVVIFSHPQALGWRYLGKRKRAGIIRAYDIPYWGTAQRVLEDYYL